MGNIKLFLQFMAFHHVGTGSWNPSWYKIRTCLIYIFNIMGASRCRGDARGQGISNNYIDYVETE